MVVAICGYFAFRSVEVTSGKETNFRAILNAVVDLSMSQAIGAVIITALGGTAYYNWKGRKKAEIGAGRAAEFA